MHSRSCVICTVVAVVACCLTCGCGNSDKGSVNQAQPQAAVPHDPSAPPQAESNPAETDYIAAYDALLADGVTPETNAAVLLWQAYGPGTIPEDLRDSFFTRLGISPPPPDAQFLIDFSDFVVNSRQGVAAEPSQPAPDELLKTVRSRPWTRHEFPVVVEWLDRNSVPLRLIEEALLRQQYYSPQLLPTQDRLIDAAILEHAVRAFRAAELLAARATLRLAENDVDGAWADLQRICQLAHLVGLQGNLAEWNWATTMETVAFRVVTAYCRYAEASSTRIADRRTHWEEFPRVRDVADVFDREERVMHQNVCALVARDPQQQIPLLLDFLKAKDAADAFAKLGDDPANIDWRQPIRVVDSILDRYCAAMRLETRRQRDAALEQSDAQIFAIAEKLRDANDLCRRIQDGSPTERGVAIGEIVFAHSGLGATQWQTAQDRHSVERELVRVALALTAFRADHAQYPDGLDELVPSYQPALPMDIFNDRVLTYRRERDGFILYSVGPNGVDDGGRHYPVDPDDRVSDDCVVRITPHR